MEGLQAFEVDRDRHVARRTNGMASWITGRVSYGSLSPYDLEFAPMTKPQPAPLDPALVPDLARAVVAHDRFPMLATMDGQQPRVRPVSPVRTDGFTIYVANLRSYHK